MVRHDLRVARVAWLKETRGAERLARKRTDFLSCFDADGRAFDFHALRSQFITGLSQAGASLVEAQRLARHSDPRLTTKHYTHLAISDLASAVGKLASLNTTPDALRATGTADIRAVGASGGEVSVAALVAAPIAISGYSVPSLATTDASECDPTEK